MRILDLFRTSTRSGAGGPVPYGIACLIVVGGMLVWTALGPSIAGRSPLQMFIGAVVLSAGLYGVGPGIAAVAVSLVLALFVFVDPNAPNPLRAEDVASMAVFLIIGAAMLVFSNHLREARRRALLLEGELQHVQAAAAISTMAGTLAHELNQPLTAATNYVAACRQFADAMDEEKRGPLGRGLSQAEAQIQRAGAIVRDARALVRNVEVERARTWLRPTFERVIEVARANEGGARIRFSIIIGEGASSASLNAIQIEQVLFNLVRNAFQAMASSDDPAIILATRRAENGILIEVRDNGPGIPRDRLPVLFSPARGSSGSGLGVGLSICRSIVEGHGGSIMAQNHPEGGAAFLILIPEEQPSG
jgi:C4-dicarboxylate-specific signal transduction histidine kinase